MRIRYIKIILQSLRITLRVLKYCDTVSSSVDPSSELLIPAFYLKNGGSVGALGKDKELLIKSQTIVTASGLQEMTPHNRIGHCFCRLIVHLAEKLVFSRHQNTSLSSGISGSEILGDTVLFIAFRIGGRNVPAEHGTALHRLRLRFGNAVLFVVDVNHIQRVLFI